MKRQILGTVQRACVSGFFCLVSSLDCALKQLWRFEECQNPVLQHFFRFSPDVVALVVSGISHEWVSSKTGYEKFAFGNGPLRY